MPTRIQIEARALEVYDLVKSGAKCEDALIELKANWPSAERAARRIAGQVNAARGEGILWIIGLDENSGVRPLDPVDVSEWWAQVRSCFDRATPTLTDIVVQTEDGPIQVLYFDASQSPFVVRNPAFGRDGGPVEREVPWREGTGVRSATRADLLRLLVPTLKLPEVEILHARVYRYEPMQSKEARKNAVGPPPPAVYIWRFHMKLYVTPVLGELVVLPVHRTSIAFRLNDGAPNDVDKISYVTPSTGEWRNPQPDSASIATTGSEAIIHLPGLMIVNAEVSSTTVAPEESTVTIRYAVRPIHTEHVLQRIVSLPSVEPQRSIGESETWEMRAETGAPGSW